jgi:hypothetical protein
MKDEEVVVLGLIYQEQGLGKGQATRSTRGKGIINATR